MTYFIWKTAKKTCWCFYIFDISHTSTHILTLIYHTSNKKIDFLSKCYYTNIIQVFCCSLNSELFQGSIWYTQDFSNYAFEFFYQLSCTLKILNKILPKYSGPRAKLTLSSNLTKPAQCAYLNCLKTCHFFILCTNLLFVILLEWLPLMNKWPEWLILKNPSVQTELQPGESLLWNYAQTLYIMWKTWHGFKHSVQ